MLRELIFVMFITSFVLSFICTFVGVSDEGRMFLALFNGVFWGRHFYLKYYANKPKNEENEK